MKRLCRERLAVAWWALVGAVAGFLAEAAFRLSLARDVLLGSSRRKAKARPWIRSMEAPILVDVFEWTSDRLIFSVLVWPALDAHPSKAIAAHDRRAAEVVEAIARGAADREWCTYWEVDHGLRWDHGREVWVDGDGAAYDGSRFGGSRRPPDRVGGRGKL